MLLENTAISLTKGNPVDPVILLLEVSYVRIDKFSADESIPESDKM